MHLIYRIGAAVLFEWPAGRQGDDALVDALRQGGERVSRRIINAAQTPRKHTIARHIIGIERWGDRRLLSALGAVGIYDEYDDYRPPQDATWSDLVQAFHTTRAETLSLAEAVQERRFLPAIVHNQFGPMTPRAWLRYLDNHANWTSSLL